MRTASPALFIVALTLLGACDAPAPSSPAVPEQNTALAERGTGSALAPVDAPASEPASPIRRAADAEPPATPSPVPLGRLRIRVLGTDGRPYAELPVVVSHSSSGYEVPMMCGTGLPRLFVYERALRTDAKGVLDLELPPDWLEHDELSCLQVLDATEDEALFGARLWIASVHEQREVTVRLAPKRLIASGHFVDTDQGARSLELQVREAVPAQAKRRDPVNGLDGTRRDLTAIASRADVEAGRFEVWGWPAAERVDLRFERYRRSGGGVELHLAADVPVGSRGLRVEGQMRRDLAVQVQVPGGELPANLMLELSSVDPDGVPDLERMEARVPPDGSVTLQRVRPGRVELTVVLLGSGRTLAQVELPEFGPYHTGQATVVAEPPGDVVRLTAEQPLSGTFAKGMVGIRGSSNRPSRSSRTLIQRGEATSILLWLDDTDWSLWARSSSRTSYVLRTNTPPKTIQFDLPRSGEHDLQELLDEALAAERAGF